MDDGLIAAARRFPDRRRAVETLAAADETFWAICADFAAAEVALQGWRQSTSAAQKARCAEYEELVEALADEIAAHLDAARDVPPVLPRPSES